MNVKYFSCDNPLYTVVLPENKEIKDLPIFIQEAVSKLGIHEECFDPKELPDENVDLSSEILEGIEKQGAILIKTIIGFDTRTGNNGTAFVIVSFSEIG